MSKVPAQLPEADKIRESWVVHPITRATITIGTPLYVLYKADEGNDGGERGSYKGDIRIAKKLGTKKQETMFTYKDGSSLAVATADLKKCIEFSNKIVHSAQVSTVFAKKIAHAEGIIDILDPSHTQLDDTESDDDEGASGEDGDSVGEEDEDPDSADEDGDEGGARGVVVGKETPGSGPDTTGSGPDITGSGPDLSLIHI